MNCQAHEPTAFINMFMVVIQFGAIMAVIFLYFNKLNPWARNKGKTETAANMDVVGESYSGSFTLCHYRSTTKRWMDAHFNQLASHFGYFDYLRDFIYPD